MEIKIINTGSESNFQYKSELRKENYIAIAFNQMFEYLSDPSYEVKNCIFDKELVGKLCLVYPFRVFCEVEVKVNSLHELIKKISEVYYEIYKHPKKYQIWGHSIYDLTINSIQIYKDNSITVGIDS